MWPRVTVARSDRRTRSITRLAKAVVTETPSLGGTSLN